MKILARGYRRNMGKHELVDENIISILNVRKMEDDDGIEIEMSPARVSLNGDYRLYVTLSQAEVDYLSYRSITAPLEAKIRELEERLEFIDARLG